MFHGYLKTYNFENQLINKDFISTFVNKLK